MHVDSAEANAIATMRFLNNAYTYSNKRIQRLDNEKNLWTLRHVLTLTKTYKLGKMHGNSVFMTQ